MSPKFNIDRPKISDDELKKHQDFDSLVKQFKEQSLKKARGDESWWKNKRTQYSMVIAGITVICTITYAALFNNESKKTVTHETLITQKTTSDQTATPAQASSTNITAPAKNKTARTAKFINEPSEKLKIKYSAYTINNSSGGTISHTSNSKIKIPKNSFVDKNGKDIIGDVTIEYKEFHDMGDVIASGIPMAYDSAGTAYNLETAGMFDIRGNKDGEPVFVKADKNLKVELASETDENRFNQYYLDTVARNWAYIKRDKARPVVKKQFITAAITTKGESSSVEDGSPKLRELKRQFLVVLPKKIDSVRVVYTTKVERLPRPKEPVRPAKSSGRPVFQLESDVKEFPELQAFKNAVFEVGDENKNYAKDLHDVTWSDVKISQGPVKSKNYLLTLSYRNRIEKLIVYPVLQGADYTKAKEEYDSKLDNYQVLVDKKQAEEKRLIAEMESKQAAYIAEQKKKEADYNAERAKMLEKYNMTAQNELASNFNSISNQARATRIFNVSRFGIYNSDCPHNVPTGASVNAHFVSASQKNITPSFIYLIDHTAKTVYSINLKDGFNLKYNPLNDYSICVFNGSTLFLCNKDAFKQTVDHAGSTFVITPLPDGSDNLTDFKKALEI